MCAYSIMMSSINQSSTYTLEEWDEQCRKDFEKHGPVPEDKE